MTLPDGGRRDRTAAVAGSARTTLALVTGVAMIALGTFIALRPLWVGRIPLTSSTWLDVAFAFVFLVRGVMNVRGVMHVRGAGRRA